MPTIKAWRIEGVTFKTGDRVWLEVQWPGGKSHVTGTLITIANGEAYIDSDVGAVVGSVDGLEHA